MNLQLMKKLLQYMNEMTAVQRDFTVISRLQHELIEACGEPSVNPILSQGHIALSCGDEYDGFYTRVGGAATCSFCGKAVTVVSATVRSRPEFNWKVEEPDYKALYNELRRQCLTLQTLTRVAHDASLPLLRATINSLPVTP